jgi:hypothetical protein
VALIEPSRCASLERNPIRLHRILRR